MTIGSYQTIDYIANIAVTMSLVYFNRFLKSLNFQIIFFLQIILMIDSKFIIARKSKCKYLKIRYSDKSERF